MLEEDSDAGEMQQAQEVVDMTFPARDETTRVAARQIVPRSARAQDPEDAVEDRPRRRPGAPSSIRSTSRSKDRFEDGPLLIGEIHAPECGKKKLPLGALIVHLNDAHHWTRERIAAWVADPDVPQDESHAHH